MNNHRFTSEKETHKIIFGFPCKLWCLLMRTSLQNNRLKERRLTSDFFAGYRHTNSITVDISRVLYFLVILKTMEGKSETKDCSTSDRKGEMKGESKGASSDRPMALINETGLIVEANDMFCLLVDTSAKKLIKNVYITDLTKFDNPAILLEAVHELDELFTAPYTEPKTWKAMLAKTAAAIEEEYYVVISKKKDMMKQGHHSILEAFLLPASEVLPSNRRKSTTDIPIMERMASSLGDAKSSSTSSSVSSSSSSSTTSSSSLDRPKSKVLIVDDSPTALKVMGRMVQRLGHEVVMAVDGMEALDKLRTLSFDIVLMDINMPKMNGLQAAHEFRKIEEERNRFYGTKSKNYLKIIAMSGDISNTLFHEVTNAGFDTFIPKPLTEAKFIEVLNMPNPMSTIASNDRK
jgi:CheY-like chemotaxis protein